MHSAIFIHLHVFQVFSKLKFVFGTFDLWWILTSCLTKLCGLYTEHLHNNTTELIFQAKKIQFMTVFSNERVKKCGINKFFRLWKVQQKYRKRTFKIYVFFFKAKHDWLIFFWMLMLFTLLIVDFSDNHTERTDQQYKENISVCF